MTFTFFVFIIKYNRKAYRRTVIYSYVYGMVHMEKVLIPSVL